ncbi:PQQ-dependent sugar dehydrogenase [Acetobacter sp. TBRC 12305]|uniref:PQQ-dependent sugar dehydrogenase n=2 Tax=Acetobacter garciniae TaxID=2817435 RepID=A0A939KRX6_9PROT|nr:PQQ-dependent sugar dehydrogenase [Acetobacter garciniae]MBX0346149.1 PQQ-dependent sugar dehydrogenase [Acetobacter garciniae]
MAQARPLPSVPPGFTLNVLSDQVPGAREIALGPPGLAFVGTLSEGVVYAVSWDAAQPEKPARVRIIARDLDAPAGVAFHDGDLFVSATTRIVRLRDIAHHLDSPPAPEVVADHLPWKEGDHYWKFIAFGPDGKLYVPIGSPCNICETGHDFGKLMRMNADGTEREDIAFGLRNSVGLTWPVGATAPFPLYLTDNGRDWMGDTKPSDELNRLDRPGQDFGFPHCHQGDLPDPEFGAGHSCADYTAPIFLLGPHVAALGLRFYEGSMLPPALRGSLIVAEHGSWNSSTPVGYRVVAVTMQGGKPVGENVLLNGLSERTPLARPADVQPLPDGSVLISDEMHGRLFRLTYTQAR